MRCRTKLCGLALFLFSIFCSTSFRLFSTIHQNQSGKTPLFRRLQVKGTLPRPLFPYDVTKRYEDLIKGYVEVGRLKSSIPQHISSEVTLGNDFEYFSRTLNVIPNPGTYFSPNALARRGRRIFKNGTEMHFFLLEQYKRRRQVLDVCNLNYSLPSTRDYLRRTSMRLASFVYDKKNYLSFCPVYKAASTSWSVNLLKLNKVFQFSEVQRAMRRTFRRVPNKSTPFETQGSLRFLIVRHPFERLVSCYRDKYENATKLYYYTKYGSKMVSLFREKPSNMTAKQASKEFWEVHDMLTRGKRTELPKNMYAKPIGPTFSEFVRYIVRTKYDDEHWSPYSVHCSVCSVKFHFILRFEDLQRDSRNFIEYINRTNEIQPVWENPTSGGETTHIISCTYYSQLTVEEINSLVKKYSMDLNIFGYKSDYYIRCASKKPLM